jgi:hypothetical protein
MSPIVSGCSEGRRSTLTVQDELRHVSVTAVGERHLAPSMSEGIPDAFGSAEHKADEEDHDSQSHPRADGDEEPGPGALDDGDEHRRCNRNNQHEHREGIGDPDRPAGRRGAFGASGHGGTIPPSSQPRTCGSAGDARRTLRRCPNRACRYRSRAARWGRCRTALRVGRPGQNGGVGMRDVDDRILGRRGVLAVSVSVSVAALIGGFAAVARSDAAAAVVAFLVALWFGFWASQRWRSPRA